MFIRASTMRWAKCGSSGKRFCASLPRASPSVQSSRRTAICANSAKTAASPGKRCIASFSACSAAALSSSGRHAEAEQALKEALARWSEAQKRFPDDQQFAHRIFEARMNMPESPVDQGAPAVEAGTLRSEEHTSELQA